MASGWASAGVLCALLAGAARASFAQPGVPPVGQPAPGTPAAVAPGQQPADGDATKRLGRKYPIPMPPPAPREAPEFHVSVVPPQDSGVHQHGPRQRMQDANRTEGTPGGTLAPR